MSCTFCQLSLKSQKTPRLSGLLLTEPHCHQDFLQSVQVLFQISFRLTHHFQEYFCYDIANRSFTGYFTMRLCMAFLLRRAPQKCVVYEQFLLNAALHVCPLHIRTLRTVLGPVSRTANHAAQLAVLVCQQAYGG